MINALEKVIYPNGKTKAIADLIPGSVSAIIDEVHSNTSAISSITSQLSALVSDVNSNTSSITAINTRLGSMINSIAISGNAVFDNGSVAYGNTFSGATGGIVTKDNFAGITLNGVGYTAFPALSSGGDSFNVISLSTLDGSKPYEGVIFYSPTTVGNNKKKAVVKKKGETR